MKFEEYMSRYYCCINIVEEMRVGILYINSFYNSYIRELGVVNINRKLDLGFVNK